MFWIGVALLNPILHAWSNVIDTYLTNRLVRNVWSLGFFTGIFAVIFLPVVVLIQRPDMPPFHLLPYFFLIGAIEVFYLFPYYKSLQKEDTSVVAALFSLGKFFVPLFSFFAVGEVLRLSQYIGFFIIVMASMLLSLNKREKIRLNKAFFYMLFSGFLLAIEAVVYKYVLESVSWSTAVVSTSFFSGLIALSFLLISHVRRTLLEQVRQLKDVVGLFTLNELIAFAGNIVSPYVVSLVPVTVAKSVEGFQPFFVLLYAIIFRRWLPGVFQEVVNWRVVLKKTALFACMIIGVVLVVG